VMEHPLTSRHAGGVIAEMLIHVGSPLLRNAAAVGGHLARGRLSDVVPVCLALDALVVVYDGEYRSMPLETYYRRLAHREPHVLTEVVFPPLTANAAASFLRFSRSAFDHALVNVACRADMEDGMVTRARIAVGASFGPASLMPEAEAPLIGSRLEDEVIDEAGRVVERAVDVDSTWMAGDDYRRHLAATLVRRSLGDVRRRLGGEA
jgi:CO/xanthine dehydrogenase FAD-binding subunit